MFGEECAWSGNVRMEGTKRCREGIKNTIGVEKDSPGYIIMEKFKTQEKEGLNLKRKKENFTRMCKTKK